MATYTEDAKEFAKLSLKGKYDKLSAFLAGEHEYRFKISIDDERLDGILNFDNIEDIKIDETFKDAYYVKRKDGLSEIKIRIEVKAPINAFNDPTYKLCFFDDEREKNGWVFSINGANWLFKDFYKDEVRILSVNSDVDDKSRKSKGGFRDQKGEWQLSGVLRFENEIFIFDDEQLLFRNDKSNFRKVFLMKIEKYFELKNSRKKKIEKQKTLLKEEAENFNAEFVSANKSVKSWSFKNLMLKVFNLINFFSKKRKRNV